MDVNDYSKKQLLAWYKSMFLIRKLEEEVFELYKQGLMPGLAHLYMGEEAVAVGVCSALGKEDLISSTHRGHGHLIARGADPNKMMAEILGKSDGYCRGKGGSMHIMAIAKGILGANGIVGSGIPIATGAAYGAKYRKTEQVVISFFGDGAANQGTFHESINMAAIWKLPVIYVLENNLYGISGDIRDLSNTKNLAERAAAYGIPGVIADGMDVIAVYEATKVAIERVKKNKGPTLIECKTYRWQGHHVGDPGEYRKRKNEKERDQWLKKCPLLSLKERVLAAEKATEKDFLDVEREVEQASKAAVRFAKESPYPELAEAYTDVYA